MKGVSGQGWREEIESWGTEREALLVNGRSFSFLEIVGAIDAFSDELKAEEVGAGELVGLLAPPSAEGFMLIHALLDRGVVMVPLNLRWTAAELRSAIGSADVRWLIVSEETEGLGAELAEKTRCGLLRLEPSNGAGRRLTRRRSPDLAEEDRFRARREEMRSREGRWFSLLRVRVGGRRARFSAQATFEPARPDRLHSSEVIPLIGGFAAYPSFILAVFRF